MHNLGQLELGRFPFLSVLLPGPSGSCLVGEGVAAIHVWAWVELVGNLLHHIVRGHCVVFAGKLVRVEVARFWQVVEDLFLVTCRSIGVKQERELIQMDWLPLIACHVHAFVFRRLYSRVVALYLSGRFFWRLRAFR